MDIIGLGTPACKIAQAFSQYPQYGNIYKVDTDCEEVSEKNINCFSIPEQDNPEKYEANTPSFKKFFKKLDDEVLFIVTGSGKISGMSLTLLEQIKGKKITVLFIRPDPTLLSEKKKKLGRAVFGVLQEYTRSGIFNRMLIVDNAMAQKAMNKISIMNFFEKINEFIVSTIHMTNVYHRIGAVYENKLKVPDSCRIGTVGSYQMETSENKMMFDLDFPRHKRYFYCINNKKLNEDQDLIDVVSSQMKAEASSDEINVSFGVYATNYEDDYVYSVWYTNKIQEWS